MNTNISSLKDNYNKVQDKKKVGKGLRNTLNNKRRFKSI